MDDERYSEIERNIRELKENIRSASAAGINVSRIDRNITALEIAAQQDRAKIASLERELQGAKNSVSTLTAEVSALRVQVITVVAKINGTGRTT